MWKYGPWYYFPIKFCAWIGPLQLEIVLVIVFLVQQIEISMSQMIKIYNKKVTITIYIKLMLKLALNAEIFGQNISPEHNFSIWKKGLQVE